MSRFDKALAAAWVVVTVAIVYLALTAPIATAKPASPHTVLVSYAAAERYWNARGLDPCNGALFQRALPLDVLGEGRTGPFEDGASGCSITLNSRVNWREAAAWLMTTEQQPNARELFCAVVTHERGHNLGLEHSRMGIMAAYLTTVPRICRRVF